MRIKWNRHLDGTATRQPEESCSEPQADKKKNGASSSPGIFRIFRRKKGRKRGDDEDKTSNADNGHDVQQKDVDEDCASINSIATCASQPTSEGFSRDRASSLFSSFRLSLPGSKRKKRRIAPAPSDTLLSEPQKSEVEPQAERYSTPDLRKPSIVPDVARVSHATSSPSIRHPKADSALQTCEDPRSQSSDKVNTTASAIPTSSSTSKLFKSVSFSNRGRSFNISHSACDKEPLRAADSTVMVEEDSGVPKSELPECMSDNLCESKLTSFGDFSPAGANAADPRKQLSDEQRRSAEMTKTVVGDGRPIKDSKILDLGKISTDMVSGNNFCAKNLHSRTVFLQQNDVSVLKKPDYVNRASAGESVNSRRQVYYGRTSDGDVRSGVNNERCDVHVNFETSPKVQRLKTGSVLSPVTERNTFSAMNPDGDKTAVSNVKSDSHPKDYVHSDTDVQNKNLYSPPVTNVFSSSPTQSINNVELSSPAPKFDNGIDDVLNDIREDLSQISGHNTKALEKENSLDESSRIIDKKHLICHLRSYTPTRLSVESSKVSVESLDRTTRSSDDLYHERKPANFSIAQTFSLPTVHSNSKSIYFKNHDYNVYDINTCDNDQQVPNRCSVPKCSPTDEQEVPEFELSLLEFEKMCNNYVSPNNTQFSDTFSTAVAFESPRLKSVRNLGNTFTKVRSSNEDTKFYSNNGKDTGSSFSTTSTKDIDSSFSLDKSLPDEHTVPSTELNCLEEKADSVAQIIDSSSNVSVLPADSDAVTLCQSSVKIPLPVPPKQWINREKPIKDESCRDVCTDRVQCTGVRGKNLCQQSCLGGSINTVMHGESDLGFIDNLHLSSTSETFDQSGRECGLTNTSRSEDSQIVEQKPSDNMTTKLNMTLSNLHGVLDYSLPSEPTKAERVYLDPEIRKSYRQRGICDPLVYSVDSTEPLITEAYLSGHNFSDIISDISCDYVSSGQGLIEISNPYADETFIVPHEISKTFVNELGVYVDSVSKNDERDIDGLLDEVNFSNIQPAEDISQGKSTSNGYNYQFINEESSNGTQKASKKSNDGEIKNKLSITEKNNIINKTKSSMIPCRTNKGPRDVEPKRLETKIKPKKAIPKLRKNESQNKNPHRMFTKTHKDSDAGFIREQNNHSSINHSDKMQVKLDPDFADRNDCVSKPANGQVSGYYALEGSSVSTAKTNGDLKQSNSLHNLNKTGDNGSTTVLERVYDSKNGECDRPESVQSLGSESRSLCRSATFTVLPFSNAVKSSEVLCVNGESKSRGEDIDSECTNSILNEDEQIYTPSECSENTNYQSDIKSLDINFSKRNSLPVELVKRNFTSSKESLNSQLTNSSYKGASRIPRKQAGTRGVQSSVGKAGPVRPPLWLSKAELSQEIQRLGTLCEARTKELNRLKMETKHVSVGFDAFAALFKYMVEDLNGLSVPTLTEDLQKTLKQLELAKQDLAYYEKEVEEIKSHHCQELNDLSNKLFEVYQSEVAELNAKHQEEINHLKNDHEKQIEILTTTYDTSSAEAKAQSEKMLANMEQEISKQREELELFHEREIKDLEEKHAEGTKVLQEHVEQLQKKCMELKQHAMNMEDAMQKDTDSKLQWVSAAKSDLEKEVESLKAVLEMKNKELHTLRVQNLEMEKQLEELPIAREKIKMLQARAEDLEALMIEKTNMERKLSTENQQMKDTYEKEAKVNRRLSMENEELQWRLRQAENSIILGSFTDVPEIPEVEENATAISPIKSPSPQQTLSRSVFFTYVDKDEASPHSPRSAYKKITPGFSAAYKTSPAKSSKPSQTPSPNRAKSHSEPLQPIMFTSTPRKNAKMSLSKSKSSQKRQRSESAKQNSDPAEASFSSVNNSMTSSVSSECSNEQREKLLDEHKEHIISSLEILSDQRSDIHNVTTVIEKKWCSDDIKVIPDSPTNLTNEDMSRSAEFSDPKTYYQMTFAVLKEAGETENSSNGNSPVKEVPSLQHSKSEDNINSSVESNKTVVQLMSMSSQEMNTTFVINENEELSTESMPFENKQADTTFENKQADTTFENKQTDTTKNATENNWRTI